MSMDSALSKPASATPGPWVTEKRGGDEWWFGGRDGMEIVVRPANEPYGAICVLPATPQEGPADEHARLIAAAPDLLAALQALADSVEAWNRDVETVIGRQPQSGMATAQARAAIAKATGEQA